MKLKSQHKSSKWLVAATAAGLLAAPAAPALAASAQASLTNFNVQLLDLNYLDLVTPSITTWDASTTTRSYSTDTGWNMGNGLGLFNSAASSSSVSPNSIASATVTGGSSPYHFGASLTASGSASAPVSGGNESFDSRAKTDWQFVLSPYTMVIFMAQGTIAATATTGSATESDGSTAGLSMRVSDNNGYLSQVNRSSGFGGASFSDFLYVSFANLTGSAMTGYFSAETNVSGYSNVTPVPEPETWAMLLAGLGLVGGMAKRRRKTAA